MFVDPNVFDFTKEGYFEFTMKSNNEILNQNDHCDRFGIYLGYNTDTTGLFIAMIMADRSGKSMVHQIVRGIRVKEYQHQQRKQK